MWQRPYNITPELLEEKKIEMTIRKNNRISIGRRTFSKAVVYSFIAFWSLVCLFPFFWSLLASFSVPYDIPHKGLNPMPITGHFTTQNYKDLFESQYIGAYIPFWIQNSLIFSVTVSVLQATLNLIAGYALANIEMKGKKLVVGYFMFILVIPTSALFIPTYVIFVRLGVLEIEDPTIFMLVLVCTSATSPGTTLNARQFFFTQSREMEEAAKMEGYTRLQIFFKITMKKLMPLWVTTFVMSFAGAWNAFLIFQLYSAGESEKLTITAGTLNVAHASPDTQANNAHLLALTNLTMIPLLLVYVFTLKFQLKKIRGGNK